MTGYVLAWVGELLLLFACATHEPWLYAKLGASPRYFSHAHFQILALVFFGALGGMFWYGFLERSFKTRYWRALLWALGTSAFISAPFWGMAGFQVPHGHKASALQQQMYLKSLFLILMNGFPLWVLYRSPFSAGGSNQVVRGTQVIRGPKTAKQLARLLKAALKKGNKPGIFFWGDSRLPFSKECQHLLIAGSPGSGKTQIIYPLVKQVIARGDKAVIWDVKGDYTQALFGQPGVQLLAPWDARSVAWRPGADILNSADCDQTAEVIIPKNSRDAQPFFSDSARDLLRIALEQLDATGRAWGWQDLWEMIGCGKEALAQAFQRSDEGRYKTASLLNAKSGGDVYATLHTSADILRWLAKAWPRDGISLREWVKSSIPSNQVLILGGTPNRSALAGPTANLAVQMMVNQLLSMGDDQNRRVWFFLDELGSLGRIKAVADLSTLGRSKGGCVVAGIQDIGKIEHLYGRELAKSMANTFSTTIFLRCADAATSQWASDAIGEQEVVEETSSQSRSSSSHSSGSGSSDSQSQQQQIRRKPAFLASEISGFHDMEGVFRLAGWPAAHLIWPYTAIPKNAPLSQEAPWVNEKMKLYPEGVPPPKEDGNNNKKSGDERGEDPDDPTPDNGFNI